MMEFDKESAFDVSRYLRVLWRWKYLILLVTLLAGAAAWLVNARTPPTYLASAGVAVVKTSTQLIFDPKFVTTSGLNPGSYVDPVAQNRVLMEIVGNPEIAKAVVARLGNRLAPDEQNPGRLADSISATSDTNALIRIRAASNNPDKAALLANTWAQAYVEEVNALYGDTGLTSSELGAQAVSAKSEYDGKESALATFLTNNSIDQLTRQIGETKGILDAFQAANQNARLAVFNQQTSAKIQTLTDLYTLQAKLDRLSADAVALRSQSTGDKSAAAGGDQLAALLLEASAFSTWSNLPVDLQIPLDQVSAGGTPADQVKRLDTLISTLQDRHKTVQVSIDAQAKDILSNLTASTAPAGSLEQSVTSPTINQSIIASINALQAQSSSLQAQLELENAKKQELIRARDLAWSSYTTLATKAAETSISQQAQSSLVRLATPASAPSAPSSPRTLNNVLLALAAGLMLSVGGAFAFEFLDTRVRTEAQISRHLGLQILSAIPPLARRSNVIHRNGSAPLFALDARAPATESLRVLRHHLLTSSTPSRVLVIASAMPGEGKSTLAANLAVLMAQAGKRVLLVDADLRRSALHRIFGIENSRGLTEILNGDLAGWESYIQATAIPGLSVITSGPPVADSATLFESPTFARWLDQCKAAVDVVIIDTPAVLGMADGVIAAHHADAIVLVVGSGAVSESNALRARDRLVATGVPLLGVVLNRADRTARTLAFAEYYQTPVAGSAAMSSNGHGDGAIVGIQAHQRDV